MIFIVSSSPHERAAFAALCESKRWTSVPCDSLRAFRAALRQTQPQVVLARNRLNDGYSDDILNELQRRALLPAVKVVVLLGPGATSSHEARQLALGADAVQRDPVRTDVLAEYLAKFRTREKAATRAARKSTAARSFRLAGATVRVAERTLGYHGRSTTLTPRELQFAELLFESRGEVVTYARLFSEVLGTRFRGDTGNMRVLLAKLDASFRSIGLVLRKCVDVIPKSGYRYAPPRPTRLRLARPAQRPASNAA